MAPRKTATKVVSGTGEPVATAAPVSGVAPASGVAPVSGVAPAAPQLHRQKHLQRRGHQLEKFFYQRIMKQHWKCDLEVVSNDRRNLWSIAGLAHVDAGAEQLRENVNPEIKTMVKHLHEHGHILGEGLGSRSDPSSIRAVHAALAVRAAAE
jgi:hypothetical protein